MRLPRPLTDILCTYYSFVSCARFQHYVSLTLRWQGKRNSLTSRQLGDSSFDHGSAMWSHYSSRKPSDTFRTAPSDPFLLVPCFLPHSFVTRIFFATRLIHSLYSRFHPPCIRLEPAPTVHWVHTPQTSSYPPPLYVINNTLHWFIFIGRNTMYT